MLQIGIVGLPNAGKSTLFNALTKAGAQVGNYPFTTIEPNIGVVPVPDVRLDQLAQLFNPPKVISATVNFVDIAGLVRGASNGEGLGNKFLGHIREVDAIVLVVRCFNDGNVTHVEGSLDPVRDFEILELELTLADLETVSKQLEKAQRTARIQKDKNTLSIQVLQKLNDHLSRGLPARTLQFSKEELPLVKSLWLLTSSPMLTVANVDESSTSVPEQETTLTALASRAQQSGGELMMISASIEAELAELDSNDQQEFLSTLGLDEPGLNRLARKAYDLLSLITFFTAGEKECRAWALRQSSTAIEAASSIHTDFAKGFIRAEVVQAETLIAAGSYNAAKENGKLRLEGKDYVVQDGDVVHIRFNL